MLPFPDQHSYPTLSPEGWEAPQLIFGEFYMCPTSQEPQRGLTFLMMIKGTLTRAEKENKSKFNLSKASCYVYLLC